MEKKLKVVYKKLAELIPYVNNTRTHSDTQVLQIASSIKEFGFTNPILIDEDGGVIAGHGRIMGAKKLGLEEAPTITLKGLTEAQRKAYIIADNKLALNSGWDEELLKVELQALDEIDFDLSVIGFDEDELSSYLDDNELTEGLTDEDDVPEPPEKPVTREGDVWLLGNHRLMCGDSTSVDAVEKLMDGKKAEMVFTDPPYLMDFQGGMQTNADGNWTQSFNSKHEDIKNDKMTKEESEDFLDAINNNISLFVKGAFYICFYRLKLGEYFASLNRCGLDVRTLITWDKGNHTLSNSDYMSKCEHIFYGWVKDHNFYGGGNGMDVWNIARTQKNDLHPTMKPIELCEKAIENSSKTKEIVLDLFGGSGSTLIACEKIKRHNRSMELEAKYCDVIINRWQDFTGKQATLEVDGRTFEEVSND